MDDALRFARAARRVEQEEEVLAVESLGRTDGRLRGHRLQHDSSNADQQLNIQIVSIKYRSHLLQLDVPLSHHHRRLSPLTDEDVLDGGTGLYRGVHGGFELDDAASSHTFIKGDHSFTASWRAAEGQFVMI